MAKQTKQTTPVRKVTIHNKISTSFRELHVDGAFGGLTPPGFINVNFYAERVAIPKSTEYKLTDHNALGEVLSNSLDSKVGVIREYEFGIYMNISTAIELKNFLEKKIEEFAKREEI